MPDKKPNFSTLTWSEIYRKLQKDANFEVAESKIYRLPQIYHLRETDVQIPEDLLKEPPLGCVRIYKHGSLLHSR